MLCYGRASSDLKSRETALLEAQYSDSKIQLLQQELASINNSLQAYQDERYDIYTRTHACMYIYAVYACYPI